MYLRANDVMSGLEVTSPLLSHCRMLDSADIASLELGDPIQVA